MLVEVDVGVEGRESSIEFGISECEQLSRKEAIRIRRLTRPIFSVFRNGFIVSPKIAQHLIHRVAAKFLAH
jgi:hypothetical protein